MKIEYKFPSVHKFDNITMMYLFTVIEQIVRSLGLLNEIDSSAFLKKLFQLNDAELEMDFEELPKEKKVYIKYTYQLFLFLGRGYENVTKNNQSHSTHLIRGIHKFFFQYSVRRRLILTHTDHDKYPNNRIMYIEKDYIKLLDYPNGIIPKEMIRTWVKVAKEYDFTLTQSATKLWFK